MPDRLTGIPLGMVWPPPNMQGMPRRWCGRLVNVVWLDFPACFHQAFCSGPACVRRFFVRLAEMTCPLGLTADPECIVNSAIKQAPHFGPCGQLGPQLTWTSRSSFYHGSLGLEMGTRSRYLMPALTLGHVQVWRGTPLQGTSSRVVGDVGDHRYRCQSVWAQLEMPKPSELKVLW